MEPALHRKCSLGAVERLDCNEQPETSRDMVLNIPNGKYASLYPNSIGDDLSPPPYDDQRPPFQRLPDKIVLQISNMLGPVSRASLKYTNTHLRNIIKLKKNKYRRCIKWQIACLFEGDSIAQGTIPDRLACCFCKKSHPKEDFGVRGGDAGYGIEHIFVRERSDSFGRYCWRHVPKRLHYDPAPDHHTPEDKDQGFKNPTTQRWKEVEEKACLHCGTRLNRDNKGKDTCPSCHKLCPACGYIPIHGYQRYGPPRPFDSYTKIRFVRGRRQKCALEIQDLNGIRREWLPRESSRWAAGGWLLEGVEYCVKMSFLYFRGLRKSPLYSPVEEMKGGTVRVYPQRS